ncbi:MAG: glycosyltransferase family 9 protein [Candidatus Omnitrophota bacterium]
MKILIANPFGIGDVLFTTPLIDSIKKALPDSKIAYLCNRRVVPLFEQDPRIYKIFVYEKDELRSLWQQSKNICVKEIRHLLSDVKEEAFDYVYDFSLAGEFAFFFWLAGIKKRIGYDYKKRAKFLNKKIPLNSFSDKHVVEYYLDLLKFLNIEPKQKAIKVFISEDEKAQAAALLKRKNFLPADKAIAVIPGAGASWGKQSYRKHYRADRFAAICDALITEKSAKVIILGDKKEKQIVDEVANKMKNPPAIATTGFSLREFMAVLSQCKLLLCNDGGPLHIAVGLDIPTVSIFGPVDENIYGPYPKSKKHKVVTADVDCRPCYKNFKVPDCENISCLVELKEEKVLAACTEQLK